MSSTSKRILLVEDEDHLLEAIKLNLELEGYKISTAKDGKKALKKAREERFDLIILDVMIPEIDGFEVAQSIRLDNVEVPIMFLTAKNTNEDRVNGLRRGADDYLVKPFNLEELILRVRNLIKRGTNRGEVKDIDTYTIGDKTVYFNSYELKDSKGNVYHLTKKETLLLKLLIVNEGKAVSREQILDAIWHYDVYPSTRTIDNFVLGFRKYFELDLKNPIYFHAIRGVGYKFTDKKQ